jgi:cytoskeletal protein RodZ
VGIRTKTQPLKIQRLKIQAARQQNNMANLFSFSDRRVQGVIVAIVIGAVVIGWQAVTGDDIVTTETTAATITTGDTTTNVANTPSTAVTPNTTTEGTTVTEDGEVGAATGASTTGTTTE